MPDSSPQLVLDQGLPRDGRRFLVYESEGGQQPDRSMVVIQNWAAGLPIR